MREYTYFIWGFLTLLIWIIFYVHRKDLRKEMLVMSCIVSILGLFMEAFFWTTDWWKPTTITGTIIGLEDILFGFSWGGVSAVIYEEIFKKKFVLRKKKCHHQTLQLLTIISLAVVIGNVSFFMFQYNSAMSWMLGISVAILVVYALRPDLIFDSLITGALLTLIAFIHFAILNWIYPDFIYDWWLFENLTGIVVLGVPLEDVIWFFTVGLILGPIYEFWQGSRLQNLG